MLFGYVKVFLWKAFSFTRTFKNLCFHFCLAQSSFVVPFTVNFIHSMFTFCITHCILQSDLFVVVGAFYCFYQRVCNRFLLCNTPYVVRLYVSDFMLCIGLVGCCGGHLNLKCTHINVHRRG